MLHRALALSCTASMLAAFAALAGCASGESVNLLPIAPQTVAVNETLVLPLPAEGASDVTIELSFEGPELPNLDRVATLVGASGSGEFRWTPLSSHVGEHEFTFYAFDGSSEDSESTIITVTPAADAAPVFLRPGAGGTYDLTRDACVDFSIEVRDDDSLDVQIRSRGPLPESAELMAGGPKSATLHWCPTRDQIAASERWTIELEADDGDHAPTEKDYVVVLRGGERPDCPGDSPLLTILSPGDSDMVPSMAGFAVVLNADDDMGLRDAPLLYYTTTMPEDLSDPDVTTFEQLTFAQAGADWSARIPSLGLAPGEARLVYFFASATDNDDPTGASCDHRADTLVRSFTAVGAPSTGMAVGCEPCGAAGDCAGGLCVTAAGGAVCLEPCAGGCAAGSCSASTTVEGASAMACGGVREVCGGGAGPCTNDGRESDDTIGTAGTYASPITDGMICADDVDNFRINATVGQRVDIVLDGFRSSEGDLDLALLNGMGTIVGVSAGESDTEMIQYCAPAAGPVYAAVVGYLEAQNNYRLTVTTGAGPCCTDDTREPDDTRAAARMVSPGVLDGTLCPSDDDFASFNVATPSRVQATIVFDAMNDFDLELFNPSGTMVAESTGTTDSETIDVMLTVTGRYTLRVYGYGTSNGEYLGELMVTPSASGTCTSSMTCATGTVCNGTACVDDACRTRTTCPATYLCAVAGPGSPESDCGAPCTTNAGCRSSEACKWFAEGRACGIRGTRQNGDACATFRDCGGQRACMGTWPGGYCARAGCATNSDCESGTFCVGVGGVNVCAKDCLASSAVCRISEGYDCDLRTDRSGAERFVCTPRGMP